MYGKYGCYGNMLPMVTVGETIQSQQGRSGGLNIAKTIFMTTQLTHRHSIRNHGII